MKGKSSPIIIGTRGSELALWQANFTKQVLEINGLLAELKIIKTKGDATQQWNLSFDKIEGKGFFTKELEDALLAEEIDLAVHSCKDLPTENSPGLILTAYSARANPFDILLIRKDCVDETKLLKLKAGAAVGTSSARRKAQLLSFRPDIVLQDMRGNVPTRVNKLREKNYDAIVLAAAGLDRLHVDLSEFEKVELKAPMFIPAAAQGVLAFQVREKDTELIEICKLMNDEESHIVTSIERQILHDFQGGCQIPLGVYTYKEKAHFHTWVSYATAWDAMPVRTHLLISTEGHMDKSDSAAILNRVKISRPKTVFISSELKENDYLKRVLEAHHYSLHHESFIEFTPVDFTYRGDADWLFFSSKNGVKFFFDAARKDFNSSVTRIAAINQGTAQAIFEAGFKVDFTGAGSDLKKIAAEFDTIAYGKIIFPQASKSMQSIQKNMIKNTPSESLVIYENKPRKNLQSREEQVLIFTSPMSVQAYFSQNTVKNDQIILSIGNTTSGKLEEFGIKNVKTAFDPSNWSIIDVVFSIE